ncbi:MAG: sodium:proline symporter [Bacteroidetes bacterium]|nr:MAG: sodium:proline symporter [Bacteroidota bacterium]
MTLALLDWTIIILFLILSLYIGIRYKEKAGKSLSDYFLGGRNLPWYIAGISMVATTFAADTPLAVTELVAKGGISGNWLWWNMLFGGMLTTFFFARLWRRANILTELEFIEIRYSGKAAAFLRGFKAIYMGLFMNSLIIGWVNIAMIAILRVFFDIPESHLLWYAAGAMAIAAIYSTLSGLWGVAITDVIQFAIAMTGCIVLAVIVVSSEKIGGISGLKEQLPEGTLNFFPNISSSASISDITSTLSISIGAFFAYITVQWWASWYPGAEPGGGGYIAQRMMSTKNEKHSIFATLFFQIAHYCIRPWPWIIVGLCCLILYPDLAATDKKLGYAMAMKEFLPAGLKGLLLVAFLAAYMSTISTQLNWGASYLTNDLYKRFVRPRDKFTDEQSAQKNYVMMGRVFTIFIMIIALYATSQITSISGVWEFIIECGAGLGLVLILRWYWWRINAWSEITATVAPFVAYAFSKYYLGWHFPDSFFITVGFTTIAWIVVTFITKPTNTETLKTFYSKVKPGGVWTKIEKQLHTKPDYQPSEQSGIKNLLICWLSAIVMTYSILFLTGKLILQEWQDAAMWGGIASLALIVLRSFIIRTKIFDD